MNYIFIKTEVLDFRMEVTLARPEKRNAFTPTMVNEIAHAFGQANANDAIKVVVIKAEGPVFCAGMDLKTFQDESLDTVNPALQNKNISLGEVFDSLQKPSMAIVEGNVIAGGFLMILGCTYVFTRQEVQFRLPELALGIFPFQVMASLLKVLPEKKVLQLCLETEYFPSEKAIKLGIIDGFLEETDTETLISSFATAEAKVLKAGIKSLRELPSIRKENQFAYLKEVLDSLNNN